MYNITAKAQKAAIISISVALSKDQPKSCNLPKVQVIGDWH